MSREIGALPSQTVRAMMRAKRIIGATIENVQPSSLDLSLSKEVYRMPGIAQPKRGELIKDLVKRLDGEKRPIEQPLERGVAYLVRLEEMLKLPKEVFAFANPKSTTGRLDIHARLLVDGLPRFDTVSAGYKGSLWLSVVARSFPVKISEGLSLSQLRFFNEDTRLDNFALNLAIDEHDLVWSSKGKAHGSDDLKITDRDDAIILTIDLPKRGVVGWECINSGKVLDLGDIGKVPASDFFRPMKKENGYVYLHAGRFYILSTREHVRVPPEFACEMKPVDNRTGEFRAHYAGFIDPGWGWGKNGKGKGRPLTLEVRPHEDLIVGDKQPIGKISFECMSKKPDKLYDTAQSNYLKQTGPRLAKQFKS
jgi:dCTP deaminase